MDNVCNRRLFSFPAKVEMAEEQEYLRLHYWLIRDVCQDEIEKSDIIPSINSDHSAIFLQFNSIEK